METQLLALLVLLAATNQLVSAMLRAMDRRISAPLIAIGTLLGRDSGIIGDPRSAGSLMLFEFGWHSGLHLVKFVGLTIQKMFRRISSLRIKPSNGRESCETCMS